MHAFPQLQNAVSLQLFKTLFLDRVSIFRRFHVVLATDLTLMLQSLSPLLGKLKEKFSFVYQGARS